MTRNASARTAGFMYLLYIVLAFPAMVMYSRATKAEGVAAKLAGIAAHATEMRIVMVLTMMTAGRVRTSSAASAGKRS